MANKEHKIFAVLTISLQWKHAYFQVFDGTSTKKEMEMASSLVVGQGQFSSIQTRSDIRQHWQLWSLRSTEYLLSSLCVDIGSKLFLGLVGTYTERAIAPPSDGSGAELKHCNTRSDIRQHSDYGH